MKYLRIVVLAVLVVLTQMAFSQDIGGEDVYESDNSGELIKPLKPSSHEAEMLVALFTRSSFTSFAHANELTSYLSLGGHKYLLTTAGDMPTESGIFLANLHTNSIEQLVYGDFEASGPHKISKARRWYIVQSGGGKHGAGTTALTTIVISHYGTGRVTVETKDIVVVSWDMEEGLCGSRLKDGKGGEIESYDIDPKKYHPIITVKVKEQDCQSKEITHNSLHFIFRGNTFKPVM